MQKESSSLLQMGEDLNIDTETEIQTDVMADINSDLGET